jgi:hypothetical protein
MQGNSWSKLTQEQKASLQRWLGKDWNVLVAYDATLDLFADILK